MSRRGNSPLNDFSISIGNLKAALDVLMITEHLIRSVEGIAKSFENTRFRLENGAFVETDLGKLLDKAKLDTSLTDAQVRNALKLNMHAGNIRAAMTHLEEAQSLLIRLNYEVVLAQSSTKSIDERRQAETRALQTENEQLKRELGKKDEQIKKLEEQLAKLTHSKEEAPSAHGRVSRVISGFTGFFTRTTSATPTSSPAGTPRTTSSGSPHSTPEKLPRSAT